MSGTLALASAIAALDRAALSRLVLTRNPQAAGNVSDPIGLASELLRPDSIARALAPLDRETLRVLMAHDWAASPRITTRLRMLGLVGSEMPSAQHDAEVTSVALPEVDEVVRNALKTAGVEWAPVELAGILPGAAVAPGARTTGHTHGAAHAALPDAGDSPAALASWFTPALTAVGEAAECLRALQIDALRLNRSGSVGVAAARELAERTATSQAAVSHALRQLSIANLTVSVGHRLFAAAGAAAWLALPHQSRWLALARAFLATMPSTLRDSLSDDALAQPCVDLERAGAELSNRYPLLPATALTAARQFVSDAELLGCTAQGRLTPFARTLLAGGEVADDDVAAALPRAAAGVYLQPDFTILAPGPLAPEAEAALASLTRPEQIGPASMRRVTEASLAAAFERGISPAAAKDTFARLSLTGMPQPLEYLLTNVADRVGRIVVHEHRGEEGRSRIRVAQPQLAQTVLVDRQLQHLQLTRSTFPQPDQVVVLFSRLRSDHVVSAFNEARYHASLAGESEAAAHGTDLDPVTAGPAASQGAEPTDPDQAPDPIETMIERVYVAARTEPESAVFTRRLELAIRDKAMVRVTAEARGQQRTFTLTPVALTDGRLRATDVAAGVERTLPVSMIVAVDTA